jgi:uncharacterized OsmC-like protein
MLLSLLSAAKKMGVELEGAEVRAARKMYVDLQNHGRSRVTQFVLDLFVDADLSEEQRARLEELARDGCASRNTFLNPPEIIERVHIGVPQA